MTDQQWVGLNSEIPLYQYVNSEVPLYAPSLSGGRMVRAPVRATYTVVPAI